MKKLITSITLSLTIGVSIFAQRYYDPRNEYFIWGEESSDPLGVIFGGAIFFSWIFILKKIWETDYWDSPKKWWIWWFVLIGPFVLSTC